MKECPSHKTRYINEEFALEYVKKFNQSRSPENKVTLRAYLCSSCKAWHVTSKPLTEHFKKKIAILERYPDEVSFLKAQIKHHATKIRDLKLKNQALRAELETLKVIPDEKAKTISISKSRKCYELLKSSKALSLLKSLFTGFKGQDKEYKGVQVLRGDIKKPNLSLRR